MRLRRRTPSRPDLGVVVIMLCMVALVALLLVSLPGSYDSLRDGGLLSLLLITGGFLVAERFFVNLEYRRQSVTFTLAEMPMAFALVYLDPVAAIAARVLGSVVGLLLRKRQYELIKVAFNSLMFALEAAVAVALLRWSQVALGTPLDDTLIVFLVVPAAMFASLVGFLATEAAVAQYEKVSWERLRSDLGQSAETAVLGATLGGAALAPTLTSPFLLLVLMVPVVMVWRLLLRHGRLNQRHRDLTSLHEFNHVVNHSLDVHAIAESAQVEARRLLRAQYAGVVVFGEDGGTCTAVSVSGSEFQLPQSADARPWSGVLRTHKAVLPLRDGYPLVHGRRLPHDWRDALAAPIRDSEGVVGLLVVAGREGSVRTFTDDDADRMRALADQLVVSLRRGLLHIRVEHEARHDRLTGLPNRALLERAIADALGQARSTTVLLLDLDRFKEVNDGFGHHVGDVLLQRFAERMRVAIGDRSVLSRLSGDEFAVLATDVSQAQAVETASAILAASREPFDLDDVTVAISCSIGIAFGPAHGEDASTLLRRADLAMYDAKARSGGLSVFRRDMETSSAERLRLLQDLRVAAVSEHMQAYFQPKVELATGAVVGAEALVRWNHPERGTIEAEGFVPLAEQTDLIHVITDHVLTCALTAVRGWRARGHRLGVAVNVSARSLLDELLADRIARHLNHHGVPPDLLTIEITETSFVVDGDRAQATLSRLDDLGVQLSIDDYGTGYSSLTYLRRLPVDELKIDRGFVSNMLTDDHDRVIVQSTIDLGRHLGLRVVAEGIENQEVAAQLRTLGCDLGQGRGFSAPLALPAFNEWLRSSPFAVGGPGGPGGRGDQVTA